MKEFICALTVIVATVLLVIASIVSIVAFRAGFLASIMVFGYELFIGSGMVAALTQAGIFLGYALAVGIAGALLVALLPLLIGKCGEALKD